MGTDERRRREHKGRVVQVGQGHDRRGRHTDADDVERHDRTVGRCRRTRSRLCVGRVDHRVETITDANAELVGIGLGHQDLARARGVRKAAGDHVRPVDRVPEHAVVRRQGAGAERSPGALAHVHRDQPDAHAHTHPPHSVELGDAVVEVVRRARPLQADEKLGGVRRRQQVGKSRAGAARACGSGKGGAEPKAE